MDIKIHTEGGFIQIIYNYLTADGEDRLAAGIHENDFTVTTGSGHVSINSKDEVPFGIKYSETFAVEKQRLLPHS